MAAGLLKVEAGFEDQLTSMLSGASAPGGDAGVQDAAAVGSMYKRTSNGDMYIKDTSGTGADKWEILATQTFATNIGAASSWREIVVLRDNSLYANVAAAETAANIGDTLDGITIASSDRILLSNLTSGNENVYVVSGGTGAWTLTEDSNVATAGDRLSITSGTDAGKVYAYDGAAWFQSNQSNTAEEGFIRTYIGKSASGAETPTYSSTNHVTSGNSLETAIGTLDAELGAAISTPQTRTAGPISDQAINLNVDALDAAIGANVTSTNHVSAASDVNSNISAIDTKMGADLTNGSVVLAAATMMANMQALDSEFDNRLKTTSTTAVTTITAVDSIVVDSTRSVKWEISVTKVANEADVYASEIRAVHNGTSVADATSVDFTEYGIVELGAAITGLVINVDLFGTAGSQVMRVTVTSTDSVNVVVTKIKA